MTCCAEYGYDKTNTFSDKSIFLFVQSEYGTCAMIHGS